MDSNNTNYKHDVRALAAEIYEIAKGWLILSMLCKLATFALGVGAILFASLSQASPFLVAFLSAASELSAWQSDRRRGLAEALRRKVDLEDSLGWPISRVEMSDLLVRIPSKVCKKVEGQTGRKPYFDSKEPPGVKRALENVRESAWWSKHLAEKAYSIYLTVMLILVLISLIVLVVSIQTIQDFDMLSNIGRVATSTIMLIFSLSLLRSTIGYYRFSDGAGRIEAQAEQLLNSNCEDSIQAIKTVNEYHLIRATAPAIPTWLWKFYRDMFNESWTSYRSSR